MRSEFFESLAMAALSSSSPSLVSFTPRASYLDAASPRYTSFSAKLLGRVHPSSPSLNPCSTSYPAASSPTKASLQSSPRSMAPDEEKMTRRSPLDFPIEWERPRPGRRADIFPQFSPMKTPLPQPPPTDPPEEDEEEEEKKEEETPEEEPDPQPPKET